jgi:hypothetical protein
MKWHTQGLVTGGQALNMSWSILPVHSVSLSKARWLPWKAVNRVEIDESEKRLELEKRRGVGAVIAPDQRRVCLLDMEMDDFEAEE